MVTVGLFVRLEARPGKQQDLEQFLQAAVPLVESEPGTTAWFALRFGPSSFGIFDAFPQEAARQAHLAGQLAAALMARAAELLAAPPAIESVDIVAATTARAEGGPLEAGASNARGANDA